MGKKQSKESAPSRKDKIIINAKRGTVTRLRLSGPTTLPEGRDLAAKLNSIIARYNTLFFKRPDGSEILPKISARTTTDT
jgi:hypothetical protein